METNTKIMIGVGVVGAVGLAWYLKTKSTPTTASNAATTTKSLTQGSVKPADSPLAPAAGWSPNPSAPAPKAPTNPFCTGTFAWLTKSQKLGAGDSMKSCNGKYVLTMQTDGNLVLYEGQNPLWYTSTSTPGAYLIMQDDGNMVVYDGASNPLWNSKTHDHPDAYLALQDDRNLVIYGPSQEVLWATYTQV